MMDFRLSHFSIKLGVFWDLVVSTVTFISKFHPTLPNVTAVFPFADTCPFSEAFKGIIAERHPYFLIFA
jgi:hypothetical protein